MLLDQIILTCKLRIKNERSIAAIYYLLIGEKAIQTVQDAHIFEIKQFYGIYKDLHKYEFDKKVNDLLKRNLLIVQQKSEQENFYLTDKGRHWLEKNNTNIQLTYFNGLQYERISTHYLERIFLLIQVLTNSKMQHASYIPIVDNQVTMNWVKVIYQRMKLNINDQLEALYKELLHLLRQFPEQEAEIFVDRLTGYKMFGLSIDQLSIKYQKDPHTLRLLFIGMSHRMLDFIIKDELSYPLLTFITDDLNINDHNKLTQSARVTNDLINKGRTVHEIARIRNLKVNTIYDHIVEIAIYDRNFPIDKYISEHNKEEIIHTIKQNQSFKLKNIKTNVNQDISYFQIRLVLATLNNATKVR